MKICDECWEELDEDNHNHDHDESDYEDICNTCWDILQHTCHVCDQDVRVVKHETCRHCNDGSPT